MPDPNNIIIDELKAVGMLIPKCANESVKHAFMQATGRAGNPSFAFRTCSKFDADRMKGWFRFATVRNPFDRLVSCWAQKIDNQFFSPFSRYGMFPGMSFEDFARRVAEMDDCEANQHWRSMACDLVIGSRVVPDYVGRFENLAEAWKTIRAHCPGLPELPHVNKSRRKPYQEYYSTTLRRVVEKRYTQDLETFGYGFE